MLCPAFFAFASGETWRLSVQECGHPTEIAFIKLEPVWLVCYQLLEANKCSIVSELLLLVRLVKQCFSTRFLKHLWISKSVEGVSPKMTKTFSVTIATTNQISRFSVAMKTTVMTSRRSIWDSNCVMSKKVHVSWPSNIYYSLFVCDLKAPTFCVPRQGNVPIQGLQNEIIMLSNTCAYTYTMVVLVQQHSYSVCTVCQPIHMQ